MHRTEALSAMTKNYWQLTGKFLWITKE